MPTTNCILCKEFVKYRGKTRPRKYCSRKCYYKSRVGSKLNLTEEERIARKNRVKLLHRKGVFKKLYFKPGMENVIQKINQNGKNNFNWKGAKAKYEAIHSWLIYNYGKATKCMNLECKGISEKYEHALLKGKLYEQKIENFVDLCKSCHTSYDKYNKPIFLS